MWLISYVKVLIIHFIIKIVKCGPVPQHLAFILDGNRRFSKKLKISPANGYQKALDKADKISELCRELGLKTLTLFGFSIENLKRKQDELTTLIDIGVNTLKIYEKDPRIDKYGIHGECVGDLKLMPKCLRIPIANAVLGTLKNNNLNVNLAVYYTSTNEIATALQAVADGVHGGVLQIEDIDEQLISDSLYVKKTNPDMYIRTSGETRLSNFLLWQSGFTQISFLKPHWPELSFWDLISTVLTYQINAEKTKDIVHSIQKIKGHNPRVQNFLKHLEKVRIDELVKYANEEFSGM